MTATLPRPDRGTDAELGTALRRSDRALGMERGFALFTSLAGMAVLAILGLIAWSTTSQSLDAFRSEGLGFLTSTEWLPNQGRFGALAFIYGTLVISLIALAIAVPVSLGIALFVSEAAPKRLQKGIGYLIDLLAAIPSVVYGCWGVLVLSPIIGKTFFTAGLILAVMITPIVTSISREVLRTVPAAQREAAFGLGATRWEMIRASVLPWAKGGITGAVMLGLGRAMGETIAAALVIGASPKVTLDIFTSGDAMAAVIANQFGEASGTHRSALIALGVVLFVLTIIVNGLARAVVARSERKLTSR